MQTVFRERVTLGPIALPYIVAVAIGALAYFLAAELGLTLASLHEAASPVWPASGLAVAMIHIGGRRLWPAIAIGAFAANALLGGPWVALPIALGNTLEALVGALVLAFVWKRESEAFIFARSAGYISAALIAAAISASLGVTTLLLAGSLASDLAAGVWLTWWIGDALGVMIVAPAIAALQWNTLSGAFRDSGRIVNLLGLLGLAAALLVLTALVPHAGALAFLALPLVWLSRRTFGPAGGAGAALLLAVGFVGQVIAGTGPFAELSSNESLLSLQMFLATLAVSALMFVDLKSLESRIPGLAVLGAGILAGGVFAMEHRQVDKIDELHFQRIVDVGTERIREHMDVYLNLLRGGRALFAASEQVTREDWKEYSASLNFTANYPGIRGIGVILPVAPAKLAGFLAAASTGGAPGFGLKSVPGAASPRAAGEDHLIITYVEPVADNQAALGLDVTSETARRRGALAARDGGKPAMSGRITLVQDEQQRPGFLLFVPFYETIRPPAELEERRRRFRGLIYAPFVTEVFVGEALKSLAGQAEVRVRDGAGIEPESVVVDTIAGASDRPPYLLEVTEPITLANHTLTVTWRPGPSFEYESRWPGMLMSVALVLLGTLLAALIANLQSLRARANAIAADMTAALTASNARLRDAIDVMGSGFAMFDADDRLVLYNDGFTDEGTRRASPNLLGRSYEEIMRAFAYGDITAVAALPDRESWLQWRLDLHRNPPAEPIEIMWTDGRWMRVLERRTADGGTVGTWTDVTAIKVAEERLTTAIDAMDSGFALFDADDRLVIHNKGFIDKSIVENFSGDVHGRSFEEIIRAFAQSEVTAVAARAAPEDWIRQRVEQHRNPAAEPFDQLLTDGTWTRISERRTSDGGYVGIWTDVTNLKLAEARLRDAIDSINDGFALIGPDERFVIVNDRFVEMYPQAGKLAKPGNRFADMLRYGAEHGEYSEITTPEQVDSFVKQWTEIFALRERLSLERRLRDGRWVLASQHPTSDGGYVCLRTDITALKLRESELRSATEALEARTAELVALTGELETARNAANAANLGKSRFLANMSHELRTPLNAINGFSELLVNGMFGPIQPPKYREYADFINQSGRHLLSLINDILDLSKVEAGKMELHVEAVPTEQVAYASIEGVRTMAADRGVELKTSIAANCPIIHADPRAIRQVLLNLLSNAVKFTPNAGTVTLAISANENGVEIAVRDTGIGMTKDEAVKALELYGQIQSDLSRKQTGTGLGLPLVKSLVELHGGRLTLDSEKGRGTVASVVFPWSSGLPARLA